jgi:hypothetical protein
VPAACCRQFLRRTGYIENPGWKPGSPTGWKPATTVVCVRKSAHSAISDSLAEVNEIYSLLGEGLEATQLSFAQIALRAVIIFVASLWIVRLASKRFFAKKTAFDVIFGFILGSMLARAINGSEKVLPTIGAGILLALLHRSLGWLGLRYPGFAKFIKGHTEILVRDGQMDQRVMASHHIGEDDLLEDLRLNGVQCPDEVHLASLERSGEVSVIKKK